MNARSMEYLNSTDDKIHFARKTADRQLGMFRRLLGLIAGFGSHKPEHVRQEDVQRDFTVLTKVAPTIVEADEGAKKSLIYREAVLNREQRVAGYEFMPYGRPKDEVGRRNWHIHHASAEVVAHNLRRFSIPKLLGHRLAFIGVIDSFLENPILAQLPAPGMVLILGTLNHETPPPEPVIQHIIALKQSGFQLAIDEDFDSPWFAAVATLADYFIVDSNQNTPARLTKFVTDMARRYPKAQFIARGLESHDDFLFCLKLGFTFFQGPFVTSREKWTPQRVGPQSLHIINLLNRLRREAETDELSQMLKLDPVLSYRLLCYINSVASGLHQRIESIKHALIILGRQNLYRWLTLLLIGSAQKTRYAAALQEAALVRGRLMELAGQRSLPKKQHETLFIVGLVSMMDLVFQMPLREVLRPLQLDEPAQALLNNSGPLAPFLELAVASESSDQERIDKACQACGVTESQVNIWLLEAIAWAQEMYVQQGAPA